jgi:pyruvate/2-oxoglutarate dehydrogenase complex dihydrolipoamide dehydrogenase (E3) component
MMMNSSQAAQRQDQLGATLIRGRGRIIRPGTVHIGNEHFGYRDLIINTGSQPTIPRIEGLEAADYWTSDVAFSSIERLRLVFGSPPSDPERPSL